VLRAEGAVPGTWAWLRSVVEEAATEGMGLTAAAGHTAYTAGELARARAEATEAERSRGSLPVAAIEELWAAVTVERAVAALREGAMLGPVEALRRHDAERGSGYLATLGAWLDHPGEPALAARSLHVHPNTLRYRMGRITALPELEGVDLADPRTRLALRLQLAVLAGR
jgi:DNA-binding PucR family transcriptional regulator